MERIIDVLPIILLGIGQLMLALVCMNQTKRISELEYIMNKNIALVLHIAKKINLPISPKTAEDGEEDEHGDQG